MSKKHWADAMFEKTLSDASIFDKTVSDDPFGDGGENDDVVSLFLAIRAESIFSLLPALLSKALIERHTTLEHCSSGSPVTRSAGAADLFIVASGVVGIYPKGSRTGKKTTVTRGRSLELAAVLASARSWQSDWIAETPATILRVDGNAYRQLLDQNPSLKEYLLRVTVHHELQSIKNDLRLFGFSTSEIVSALSSARLVRTSEELRSEAGIIVCVHAGDFSVRAEVAGARKLVGTFGLGSYVFLANDPSLELELAPNAELWTIDCAELATLANPSRVKSFVTFADAISMKIKSLEQSATLKASTPLAPQVSFKDADEDLEISHFAVLPPELKVLHAKKFRAVLQHDHMDCGVACLATVARFYGRKISLPFFRALVHVTRTGASLHSIMMAAQRIGFRAIGVASGLRGLEGLRVPLIALMQGHFVVVHKISASVVVIGDPAIGVVKMDRAKFEQEYSFHALLLEPTPAFYELKNSKSPLWKYVTVLTARTAELVPAVLMTLIVFALGLLQPFVMQFVFDRILLGGSTSLIVPIVIILFGLNLLVTAGNYVREYLFTHIGSALEATFSALFLKQVYSLPLQYFAVRRVGDITSRFAQLDKVREFLTSKPTTIVLNMVSILIYGSIVGVYSLRLLVVLVVALGLMFGMMLLFSPRFTTIGRLMFTASSKSLSLLTEHFRSLEAVRAIGGLIAARWRYEERVMESLVLKRRLSRLTSTLHGLSAVMHQTISATLTIVAVYLFVDNHLTLGQVIGVTALAGQVLSPAASLLGEWDKINTFAMSMNRVDDVVTAAPETSVSASSPSAPIRGEIEFKGVEFRYGNETSPLALTEINLHVRAGETVAFVGKSGSGKTTLAYMINMLYAPTAGMVHIDGIPASDIPLEHLRRNISMIIQENALFSGSIVDNITAGEQYPNFQLAISAARAASAHEFISNLKHGYNTKLGEGGVGLSGGQCQRICIARALYKESPILIMDEATSALDALSEGAIMSSLRARKGTTVIIAHRLNTIRHADRIVILDQGRIVEMGSHEELIARQGSYFDLFRKQIGPISAASSRSRA